MSRAVLDVFNFMGYTLKVTLGLTVGLNLTLGAFCPGITIFCWVRKRIANFDTYRTVLVKLTGKVTSKDIDRAGFETAIGVCEYLGYRPMDRKTPRYSNRAGFCTFASVCEWIGARVIQSLTPSRSTIASKPD